MSEAEKLSEVYISLGGICHSVVTDDGWRLSLFPDILTGQMFNLADDPTEQHNLFENETWRVKREELQLRFIRAATRGHEIPHYRNMPVWEGKKRSPGAPGSLGVFSIQNPFYGPRERAPATDLNASTIFS